MNQKYSISGAARRVPCPENYLRVLEKRGVISPARDNTGRRIFTESEITAARAHLAQRANRATPAE